jgi:predicted permease
MREWLTRLRDWLRRDRLDAELADELRFHQEQLERDGGAAAARRLGNLTRLKESTRDLWAIRWLDDLIQDARYAVRGLRRSPGFAATVILTLGLGIGANAAMFGVVDRLMFRPYPYLRDPATVHRVYLRSVDRGIAHTISTTEYARSLDLRRWTSSFSQSAGFTDRTMAVGVGDASRERRVAVVNASFFDFFDARPVLGRYFTPGEDTIPRGADVAVLGYGFWTSEFGGRDVLGEVLQVGNITATIVGVAPKGFSGVEDNDPPAVYIPITTYAGSSPNERNRTTYYSRYGWGWMELMVRRKPGVTVEQASSDLSQAYLRSWQAEREMSRLPPIEVAKPEAVAGAMKLGAGPDPSLEARTALWVTGVAVIVLLIACANVANLFLARALHRQRELAVRLALGVSRGRLVRQSLTESLVLAGVGAVVGLLVGQWGGAAIRGTLIGQGASLDLLTDWRTLGVAALVAFVSALATGLAPALLTGRGGVVGSLKTGGRDGTQPRSRVRTALLVTQGTLAVVLLVGAGLFVRSLDTVKSMRLGYDAEPVLLTETNMRGLAIDDSGSARLGRTLLETARTIPGVEYASWVSSIPFYSTSSTSLYVAGIDSVSRLGRFTYQTATPDYFATMGTRIIRGRGLSPEDRAGSPRVVVVSEAMASVLWPGKDALGECIRIDADTMPCTTVVGIAENMVQISLTDTQHFSYYMPIEQRAANEGFALMVRVRGDPTLAQEPVRRALQAVMPGQSYVTVRPFASLVDGQRRSWRLGATMFTAFGALALIVAAVGLYGVIAYNVTQRMHELGVRMALGARSPDVVRLVLSQAICFAGAGVLVGLLVAVGMGRWIEPLLFRQSARDPVVLGGVAALLILVAIVASIAPAFRATRADPNTVLRSE